MGQVFWTSVVAALGQCVTLFWWRVLPKSAIAGTVVGAAASILITIEQAAKEWNYAYLVPAYVNGNQLMFFFKATANLESVTIAHYPTGQNGGPLDVIPLIRQGKESWPAIALSVGDWIFDIDALGAYGKVLQRIVIEQRDGRPVLTFSPVDRKGTHTTVCYTPKQRPSLC